MQEKFHCSILGFLFGFYLDIVNGRLVGTTAILLCLIGFFAEYMYKNTSNDNKVTIILLVLASTFAFEAISYIFSIWRLNVSLEIFGFVKILFIEIVYNVILTIIFYPIIQKSNNFLSGIFKNKNLSNKIFMV